MCEPGAAAGPSKRVRLRGISLIDEHTWSSLSFSHRCSVCVYVDKCLMYHHHHRIIVVVGGWRRETQLGSI